MILNFDPRQMYGSGCLIASKSKRCPTPMLNRRHSTPPSGAWRLATLLLAASSPPPARAAHAVVELNITQGNIQPLPIAITDFASDGSIEPTPRAKFPTWCRAI